MHAIEDCEPAGKCVLLQQTRHVLHAIKSCSRAGMNDFHSHLWGQLMMWTECKKGAVDGGDRKYSERQLVARTGSAVGAVKVAVEVVQRRQLMARADSTGGS